MRMSKVLTTTCFVRLPFKGLNRIKTKLHLTHSAQSIMLLVMIKKKATIATDSFTFFRRRKKDLIQNMYSFCVFLLVGRNGSGKSNFFSGNNRNLQKEKD